MKLFVCFIDGADALSIVKAVSSVFGIQENDVKELFNGQDAKIKYEIRVLDQNAGFGVEINVYVPEEIALQTQIYNDLLLGRELSQKLNKQIIIGDESDDPYQWILIDKDRIYLVESMEIDTEGIEIDSNSKLELSFDKALALLPQKEDLLTGRNKEVAYFVPKSSLWKNCIK